MQDFTDTVVVVTGSASGIGKALAQAFLAGGAKVVLSDVEKTALDKTAAELSANGGVVLARIFYPSGGILPTGIWTTRRNRPAELAREKPAPAGGEITFDEFMTGMKEIGVELPVQDLDELAAFALDGIRKEDFVIMIGRETMEATLVARAKKLANGQCPIEHGLHG
ncbi:SDR family NAD(P)-dependent oxidoreductase [Zhongshania sp.]|uniref:SDR family NAD(P)-dependent oxidoreductase n=1 Tax=Zhongshania sp. TaxID=1971902 RepID=UPI003567711E